MSDKKEIKPRATKVVVAKYVSQLLDMIAENKTKSEIIHFLTSTYSMTNHQANRYFIKATEQLEEDLAEKVKVVRNKRIHALHKDMREAYANYKAEIFPADKIKWYEVYQKIKNQMDQFYPNALKHESENEESRIEIHYTKITKQPEEIE